jgi:hypothetical protein
MMGMGETEEIRTSRPNNPIPLRSIDQRTRALGDGVVVVPRHIRSVADTAVYFKQMRQRISMRGINRANLIRVRARIKYAVE